MVLENSIVIHCFLYQICVSGLKSWGGTFATWQAVNAGILVPASQPRVTSNFQSLLLGCFAGLISFIDFAPRRGRNIFELDAGITLETRLQIKNKTCLGSCARIINGL